MPQPDSTAGVRFPIGILSFDRPDYLGQVLSSLRPQVDERDRIILFQDGGWNPHSRKQKADARAIEACTEIFRRILPWGTVAAAKANLGIAENYERAEQELFGRLRAPCALILEDDLVLSSNYLTVTRMLLELALRDRRIAYVSAYGNFWASAAEQQNKRGELMHMHENWGFAMTRAAWLDERAFRREYLALVANADYTIRDHARIQTFYRKRGWNTTLTSQDAARWIASLDLGKVRLTTFPCHARYIGKSGVHFSPEFYEQMGFASAVFFSGRLQEPRRPSDAEFEDWLSVERRRFTVDPQPFYPGHPTGNAPSLSA